MAKLRVGGRLGGCAPGVWRMCSGSWFQAMAAAPDSPPAGGAAAVLVRLLATAVAAPTTPTPTMIPIRTINATTDFFISDFSWWVIDSGCRGMRDERGLLELTFDPAHGVVEQLARDRVDPAASQQSRPVGDDDPEGHLDLGAPNVRTDGHRHPDPDRWHIRRRRAAQRHRSSSQARIGVDDPASAGVRELEWPGADRDSRFELARTHQPRKAPARHAA